MEDNNNMVIVISDDSDADQDDFNDFPMLQGDNSNLQSLSFEDNVKEEETFSRDQSGQEIDDENDSDVIMVEDNGDELAPPPAKKREATTPQHEESNDYGVRCTICFEEYEVSGEHRIVSLKCGHIFGDGCIRKWLNEDYRRTDDVGMCPRCKAEASADDICYLFAKSVRAVDRTEERRLQQELDDRERTVQCLNSELIKFKTLYADTTEKLKRAEALAAHMNSLVQAYELVLEHEEQISREPQGEGEGEGVRARVREGEGQGEGEDDRKGQGEEDRKGEGE
uniref:RING-type domain-containing protein n=1 Tax=Glossina brevipalpis TaxID=37001 RepID=A0A1A9WSQ7_9MUSC